MMVKLTSVMFFIFIYDGEIDICLRIVNLWREMLFDKYLFIVIHRFDSMSVLISYKYMNIDTEKNKITVLIINDSFTWVQYIHWV